MNFTPEHFKRIECVIELGSEQGKEQLFFHIGCPDFPEESVTRTNQRVADAAKALLCYWEEKGEPFAGFRVIMEQQADGKWKNSIARIDSLPNFQSPIPRPIHRAVRLNAYGVRLTPIGPFHWYQTSDPCGINASRYIKSQDGRTLDTRQVLLLIKDETIEPVLQGTTGKESDVYTKEDGPQNKEWIIEAPAFSCAWPNAFALRYPAASRTMFDLVQSDNSLIYVQGPFAKDMTLPSLYGQ